MPKCKSITLSKGQHDDNFDCEYFTNGDRLSTHYYCQHRKLLIDFQLVYLHFNLANFNTVLAGRNFSEGIYRRLIFQRRLFVIAQQHDLVWSIPTFAFLILFSTNSIIQSLTNVIYTKQILKIHIIIHLNVTTELNSYKSATDNEIGLQDCGISKSLNCLICHTKWQ